MARRKTPSLKGESLSISTFSHRISGLPLVPACLPSGSAKWKALCGEEFAYFRSWGNLSTA
jgi:hypothetical protein